MLKPSSANFIAIDLPTLLEEPVINTVSFFIFH